MYNNPLKASDAVESKSWDKYVEKGKVSHRPKKEKKDKYKSPFAMAGMAFKTDQLPMKKLTVESPYKSMSLLDYTTTGVDSIARGEGMDKTSGAVKYTEYSRTKTKSASPFKEPIMAAIITAVGTLAATGLSAYSQSRQAKREERERRRQEARRRVDRGQDQVMTAMSDASDMWQRRSASAGSWYHG